MKKYFGRCAFLLLVLSAPFVLTGCFEDSVTFRGRAFMADIALVILPDGSQYETLLSRGPVAGAKVKEAGHPETAITDANGYYTLKITVPRVIGLEKAKTYRLSCWASQTAPGTATTTGNPYIIKTGAADEPISSYADARAGDTVEVRDFVMSHHTVEKYLDQNGNTVGQ